MNPTQKINGVYPHIAKYHFGTVVRDSMFFGFCQAKIQEGKTNILENAKEFLRTLHHNEDEVDPQSIYYSYISFFEKLKKHR